MAGLSEVGISASNDPNGEPLKDFRKISRKLRNLLITGPRLVLYIIDRLDTRDRIQ